MQKSSGNKYLLSITYEKQGWNSTKDIKHKIPSP
jgi:hypothetical protein